MDNDTQLSQDGYEDLETALKHEETGEIPQEDKTTAILELENMIHARLDLIERVQIQMNELKEQLDSILENDPTYQEHSKQAKEANRVKSTTKQEIMKRPDVAHVAEKLKDAKSEVKEAQEDLSMYLQEYAQISGQTQFEGKDGSLREIVYIAKLVKVPGSK